MSYLNKHILPKYATVTMAKMMVITRIKVGIRFAIFLAEQILFSDMSNVIFPVFIHQFSNGNELNTYKVSMFNHNKKVNFHSFSIEIFWRVLEIFIVVLMFA